jgi:hypothetical protein
MKLSELHRIIREEASNVALEEGILDFVFNIASGVAGALIDKHRDYLLNNLRDDPEIRAMQRDVGLSRDRMIQAFTDRYKSNTGFKNKVDTLIKKVR